MRAICQSRNCRRGSGFRTSWRRTIPPPSPNGIGRCDSCGRGSGRWWWRRGRRWRSSGRGRRLRERERRCGRGRRSRRKRCSGRWRGRGTASSRSRMNRGWRRGGGASLTCFRRGRRSRCGSSSSATRSRASGASTWRRSGASSGCSRPCCRRWQATPRKRRRGHARFATRSRSGGRRRRRSRRSWSCWQVGSEAASRGTSSRC